MHTFLWTVIVIQVLSGLSCLIHLAKGARPLLRSPGGIAVSCAVHVGWAVWAVVLLVKGG
jgi:hypothetical protein